MNKRQLKGIACWHDVTPEVFEKDIAPLHEPAILKGLVNHWPSVNQAKESNGALLNYLTDIYVGGDVRIARLKAKEKGLFYYNEKMTDFNFTREVTSVSQFFQAMKDKIAEPMLDTVALQSAPMEDYFPEFTQQNSFSIFKDKPSPRVWLGNDAIVSAHYDDAENIACVVSGKRIFTLFPPEQIENLYLGPMEFTPAGAPVSMVDFFQPDFEKFPKYQTALDNALQAELEPGDAIYIPTLWWHHVQAIGGLNMLVNYWSGGSIAGEEKPIPADNLLMAMLSIRDLPQQQKEAWKAYFDYYIFSEQSDKHQHIPDHIKGVLAPMNSKMKRELKKWLVRQLKT